MAQIAGQRSTGQTISEGRLWRQIDDKIALLETDKAPLMRLMLRMKRRAKVESPRVEWLEDDYVARWGQNGSTTIANVTASTTIWVTDGTVFKAGDLGYVPKIITSSSKGEIFRVTAVSGNVLTVIRNVGGNGLDTMNASAAIRLIGSAYEEGATIPTMKSTTKATRTTYTQIFRTVLNFTGTQLASKNYGTLSEGELAFEHKKKMVEHLEQMNAALLWGARSEDLTGGPSGNPIRTTDGLRAAISTNITNGNGTLTWKVFEAWTRSCFRYGNQRKVLLASRLLASAINQWGHNFLMVKPGETKLGVRIKQIEVAHGELGMISDEMLEDGIASQNGFSGTSFIVDLDELEYVYLGANGVNRDTRVMRDVIKDGADRKVDEIATEGGFKVKQEKYHGMLYNVSDFSA